MSGSVADRVFLRLVAGATRGADTGGPARAGRLDDPLVAATREALGIGGWSGVATGHQPMFWHGGILAKALCAAELSRAVGQGWLHVIADHDAVDPGAVTYPARRDGHEVRCATAHFTPACESGVAASQAPAVPARSRELACTAPPASEQVAAGLDRIAASLLAADATRGAAWRTADANFRALSGLGCLARPAHMVCASALLSTPLGRACADRIAADPESCARAFNDALLHAPRAASRLRIDGHDSEVPLWEVDGGGRRVRIGGTRLRALLREGALDAGPGAAANAVTRRVLLPRAFLATGLVRALGIHFVHGTGGETYERAGDAWWRSALGRALPPFSVATADLRFRAESFGLASAAPGRALTWRDAWVDPARLDGVARDPVRAPALAAIASMPRGSPERKRAFDAMRTRVISLRAERHAELEALARADAEHCSVRASVRAATDRTYPAALHDADALAELAGLVADSISGSTESSGARGSRR